MKTFNSIFILLAGILLLSAGVFSQNLNKPLPPIDVQYSTSGITGDGNFSKVNPLQNEFSTEKKNLMSQLDDARSQNDLERKTALEQQLNQRDGTTSTRLIQNPDITGGAAEYNQPPFNNGDYMSSTILSNGVWSSATQTESSNMPHPGRIWVAATVFALSATDTCKIFYSDNGGASWTFGYFFRFNYNTDFNRNELDMELVYDGTTLFIFGTAGFNDNVNSRTNSMLFRFNTTTNAFAGYILQWPGWGPTTNKYYGPRLTSDNSNYTAAAYVYVVSLLDSAAGNGSYEKLKYAHLTDPFSASPTVNYAIPGTSGTFGYSTGFMSPFIYYYSDIAYFRTPANQNRIIACFNNTGGNNIYYSYSDDFGATIGGNLAILESNQKYGVRLAFNGGTNNFNGMFICVRLYSGNDWDPFFWRTTDGGANWSNGYVDNSTKKARTVEIIAPRSANNMFKIGYAQDSGASNNTYAYYAGCSGYSWNQPGPMIISVANVDTVFNKVVPGYTASATDNCFALYGKGAYLIASRLCLSTVGINGNNNGVPKDFALMQNYPNPFNPTTNIKFSIPRNSFVKLTVFDITGKAVATLVNAQLNAGNYTFDFDASNLATGVYLYKLQTEDFTSVKKMVLVK